MESYFSKFIATAGIAAMVITASAPQSAAQTREQRLTDHVYYFASDSLCGRESGSVYSAKAAEYIIQQYEGLGMKPFFAEGWKMPFKEYGQEGRNFFNVVGIIEGSDPALKDEYIILGAHFDHLGMNSKGVVFNGADDNASGSAALIEIARVLAGRQDELKRSVIFAAFDGEELGLYGSNALARVMSDKGMLEKVKLMVSIDMVGWLEKGGSLKIEGTGTIKDGDALLKDLAAKNAISVSLKKFEDEIFTATDTQGFAERGVATLDMTTGTKSPYHKPEDDADLIDYKGLDKVCAYVTDVAFALSSDESFTPSGKVAPKHRGKVKVFSIGPAVELGSSSFSFPSSSIITDSGFSYAAGLSAKLNFSKRFGIRAAALYESNSSAFPVEGDIFGSKGSFTQNSICVPAYFMLQSESRLERLYVGCGAFYRKVLDSRFSSTVTNPYAIKDQQVGFAFTIGFGLGPYCMSLDVKSNTSSIFQSPDINARMSTTTMNISRWF